MSNEITNQKTITTKELAEQLGCESKTIMNNAKKCLPNKVIENGKPTLWTEAEVTVLLECIKGNNVGAGVNLVNDLQGTETSLTPAYQSEKAWAMINTSISKAMDVLPPEQMKAFMNNAYGLMLNKMNEMIDRYTSEQKAKVKALEEKAKAVAKMEHDHYLVEKQYLSAKQVKDIIKDMTGEDIVMKRIASELNLDYPDVMYKPFTKAGYTGQTAVYSTDIIDKIVDFISQ